MIDRALGIITTTYSGEGYKSFTAKFYHACGGEMKATGLNDYEGGVTKYGHKCDACGGLGWCVESFPKSGYNP